MVPYQRTYLLKGLLSLFLPLSFLSASLFVGQPHLHHPVLESASAMDAPLDRCPTGPGHWPLPPSRRPSPSGQDAPHPPTAALQKKQHPPGAARPPLHPKDQKNKMLSKDQNNFVSKKALLSYHSNILPGYIRQGHTAVQILPHCPEL